MATRCESSMHVFLSARVIRFFIAVIVRYYRPELFESIKALPIIVLGHKLSRLLLYWNSFGHSKYHKWNKGRVPLFRLERYKEDTDCAGVCASLVKWKRTAIWLAR